MNRLVDAARCDRTDPQVQRRVAELVRQANPNLIDTDITGETIEFEVRGSLDDADLVADAALIADVLRFDAYRLCPESVMDPHCTEALNGGVHPRR